MKTSSGSKSFGVACSWLERRASDCKVAGSMPVLGITLLCPWERHLALIS